MSDSYELFMYEEDALVIKEEGSIIIKNRQKYKILREYNKYPICGEIMNLVAYKASKDNIIWRCHKRNLPHDIKINIGKGSFFERLQIKIPVLLKY